MTGTDFSRVVPGDNCSGVSPSWHPRYQLPLSCPTPIGVTPSHHASLTAQTGVRGSTAAAAAAAAADCSIADFQIG